MSGTLIMRWVNVQLSKVSEWVDRALQQEVGTVSYLLGRRLDKCGSPLNHVHFLTEMGMHIKSPTLWWLNC